MPSTIKKLYEIDIWIILFEKLSKKCEKYFFIWQKNLSQFPGLEISHRKKIAQFCNGAILEKLT